MVSKRKHTSSTTKIGKSEFPLSPMKLHRGQSLKHEKVSNFTQEWVQAFMRVEKTCQVLQASPPQAALAREGDKQEIAGTRGRRMWVSIAVARECLPPRLSHVSQNCLTQKLLFTSTQDKTILSAFDTTAQYLL